MLVKYLAETDRDRIEVAPRPGERPLPASERDPSGIRSIPAYQVLPGVELPSVYESRYAEEVMFAVQLTGPATCAPDPERSTTIESASTSSRARIGIGPGSIPSSSTKSSKA